MEESTGTDAVTAATPAAPSEAAAPPPTGAMAQVPATEPTLAAAVLCGNCGAALAGKFCFACGQEDREVRRPFWRMLQQTFQAMFELDSRVYRSLFHLYTRPGFLSTEFLNGRRARYTPPLRMFLVLSISFFLIVSIVGTFAAIAGVVPGSEGPVAAAGENPGVSLRPGQQIREILADDDNAGGSEENDLANLDIDPQEIRAALELVELPFLPAATGERVRDYLVEQSVRNFTEAREAPLPFFRDFFIESLEYVTVFMLLMMPLFALVLWLLFVFKRRYYVEHFILTLHNHSFLMITVYFLAATGIIAGRYPALESFVDWVDLLIVLWSFIYLYLSLKNFYGVGYIYSGLAYLAATAVYAVLLSLGFTLFLIVAFVLY